jgi:hypothetical protein
MTVAHLECRLSIEKIVHVLQGEHKVTDSKIVSRIRNWCIASRALFGEESLSLRILKDLVSIFRRSGSLEQPLVAFLREKIPSLGEYTCWQFAHHVLQHGPNISHTDLSGTAHPFQLLVNTALLDKEGNVRSYPDFVRLIPGSNKFHPIIRLASWVAMAHAKVGKQTPSLAGLLRFKVIDQVGFPLMLSTQKYK